MQTINFTVLFKTFLQFVKVSVQNSGKKNGNMWTGCEPSDSIKGGEFLD